MRNLQLPEDLCAAAEKKFGHEFGGLEGLLVFVLNDLLHDEANSADQAEQKVGEHVGDLDQRDEDRCLRPVHEQPLSADRLHPQANVADEYGKPERPEGAIAHRQPR